MNNLILTLTFLAVLVSGCAPKKATLKVDGLSKSELATYSKDRDLSSYVEPEKNPQNLYPAGTIKVVILKIEISVQGYVLTAETYQSSGDAELDRRAMDAVFLWKYKPALKKEIRLVKIKYVF